MSYDIAIRAENVGKCYHLYDHPRDRLKQMVMPPLKRALGLRAPQYFREFWSLKGVSFELARGESIGIVGRNGAGKSTLLQLLTGVLAPTTGMVEVSGRIAALLELGTGFNPEFSGRENVALNLALQGFKKSEIENKFDGIASFADIGDFIDAPVKTYSSGMYSRLAFAVAINADPDILIVDEILAVGDLAFQQKCLKRLYRMLDDGVSVLLVSHDAYQVRSVCQKALFLEKGAQRDFGGANDVMDEYIASFGELQKERSVANADSTSNSDASQVGTKNHGQKSDDSEFSVSIHEPVIQHEQGGAEGEIVSGSGINVEFIYKIHGIYDGDLTFVVNLYREDGTYVFGTTTKMQGLDAFRAHQVGKVVVSFPHIPLLSGKYNMRVAVNDGRGLHIMAEAVPVCHFKIVDDFKAVGLVELQTNWQHHSLLSENVQLSGE